MAVREISTPKEKAGRKEDVEAEAEAIVVTVVVAATEEVEVTVAAEATMVTAEAVASVVVVVIVPTMIEGPIAQEMSMNPHPKKRKLASNHLITDISTNSE